MNELVFLHRSTGVSHLLLWASLGGVSQLASRVEAQQRLAWFASSGFLLLWTFGRRTVWSIADAQIPINARGRKTNHCKNDNSAKDDYEITHNCIDYILANLSKLELSPIGTLLVALTRPPARNLSLVAPAAFVISRKCPKAKVAGNQN